MIMNAKINILVLGGLAAAFVMATVTGVAQATPIWSTPATLSELTGMRDSSDGGGVTASADWADGNFSISWVITQDLQTNLWTYQYSLTTTLKSPSHTIIEVTEDPLNLFQYEPGSSLTDDATTFEVGTPSNPDLPNTVYGVKEDYVSTEDYNGLVTTTIVTTNAPVWGVFYTKDGKTDKIPVTAWSNALNFSDYWSNETLTTTDFIVRPDGVPLIPEPASLVLVGLGVPMLLRRRRSAAQLKVRKA